MKKFYREVDSAVQSVEKMVRSTSRAVEPIRISAFRRFPTLFALLVGFGAGATFFGVERLVEEMPWLNDRPWLIILIGVVTLSITGRLHKTLD